MLIGVHVSISGKIYEAIDRAEALGCSAMQIFSRNPRQWRQKSIDPLDAEEFRQRRSRSGIDIVAVHVPYLINLATGYQGLYEKSILAYVEDINECSLLGAEYLVTHMGSFKNFSHEEGLKRLTLAVKLILDRTRDSKVRLLLENTAGSGSWLGASFEDHARVFDAVKNPQRLGVCLDTAHAFAAGVNLRDEAAADGLIGGIRRLCGKGALRLVHLNDSMSALGSRADRHQHIGRGRIGRKGLAHVVNHPALAGVAFILETPKDGPKDDQLNLKRARRLFREG